MTDIEAVETPILGADGKPLVKVTTDLAAINEARTYLNLTGTDLILAAGRMLRDGKSIGYIRNELTAGAGASLGVSLQATENFARRGLAALEARIAAGLEPEESVHTEMREQWDLADEMAVTTAGIKTPAADVGMIDPTGQNDVDAGFLRDD